jgi:hypothetical protein
MSGDPKFLIGEHNGEELGGAAEFAPDILDILPLSKSAAITYSDDLITQAIYYRSDTQTTENRVGQVDITYTSEFPTSVVCTLYDTTDGTVLLSTVTLTYVWSGDNLASVSRVIS